jgi:hypothetical protein
MCSLELAAEHEHLVEPSKKLICACAACAILFEGQSGTKYKRVPREVRFLRDFQLTDAQWDGLMVPIEMAFFFKSSPQEKVIALYPSPAGPTESLLSLDTWADIVGRNPILGEMQADVTALLVNRVGTRSRGCPCGVLSRSHRRMLQAGRADPHALARAFRRHGSVARNWRVFCRAEEGSRFGQEGAHA